MKYAFLSTNGKSAFFDTESEAIDAAVNAWSLLSEIEKAQQSRFCVCTVNSDRIEEWDGQILETIINFRMPLFSLEYRTDDTAVWNTLDTFETPEEAKAKMLEQSAQIPDHPLAYGEGWRICDSVGKVLETKIHEQKRNRIQTILAGSGMTLQRFAEHYEIPDSIVCGWADGTQECPGYVAKLLEESLMK